MVALSTALSGFGHCSQIIAMTLSRRLGMVSLLYLHHIAPSVTSDDEATMNPRCGVLYSPKCLERLSGK
jgi:hypothetical protein